MASLGATELVSGVPTQDTQGINHSLLRQPPPPFQGRGGLLNCEGSWAPLGRSFQNLKLLTHMCWGGRGAPRFLTLSLNDAQTLGRFLLGGSRAWGFEGKGGSRGVMTFLSSLTALAQLGQPLSRRLMPACSILFQPEELQKEPPASCIPRALQAVRWCCVAWTYYWSVSPLGCMYRVTPISGHPSGGWGGSLCMLCSCHIWEYKKRRRWPFVRTLQIIVISVLSWPSLW